MSDRGLAHLVLTRRGYTAITFGHVIVFAREPTDALWRHELGHVHQYERLGLAFLPLYLWLYWRHGYAKHPLELEADGFRVRADGAGEAKRARPRRPRARSRPADRAKRRAPRGRRGADH